MTLVYNDEPPERELEPAPKNYEFGGINPKQIAATNKIQLQLVPPSVMIAIATALEEGAGKYESWNWRDQPVKVMTYIGALQRHLSAWIEGEEIDPKGNGKTHLDGAIGSLAIIIDAISCNTAIDDRPKVKSKMVVEKLKGED